MWQIGSRLQEFALSDSAGSTDQCANGQPQAFSYFQELNGYRYPKSVDAYDMGYISNQFPHTPHEWQLLEESHSYQCDLRAENTCQYMDVELEEPCRS